MKKTSGYKGMLRDRCPAVVNYALKWQKAKERWINHAYENFIKFYVQKDDRNHATRVLLGIAKYYKNFNFHKSIEWNNLSKEETQYWIRVESWVNWFMKKYAYIENAYDTSRQCGKTDFEIKIEIINQYLSTLLPNKDDEEEIKVAKLKYVDNFIDFLFKCLKGCI